MRSKSRARPSRHNDTGHHGAHLARHAQSYQVGYVNLRPEWLQLGGAYEGEDYPHEKTDERDNRQCLGAAFLHGEQQVDTPKPGPAPHQLHKGQDHLS